MGSHCLTLSTEPATMNYLFVAALLIVGANSKFCPSEGRPGVKPRCVANETQYKCGVFLEDLKPKLPLAWLGALPDKLKTVEPSEYEELLGPGITPESFQNFGCAPNAANSRCYATMTKFISEPLDSCNKNLVNTKQSQTIGDYLCQQVRRWLKNDADFKANGRDNIQLPVYYSQCGQDWTPVSDGASTLYVREPLCCNSDDPSEDVMALLSQNHVKN